MGADLIVSYLVRKANKTIQFSAAQAHLDAMTNREIAALLSDSEQVGCLWEFIDYRPAMGITEYLSPEQESELVIPEPFLQTARDFAEEALDSVQSMWDDEWRTATHITVPGYDILITGELSWGDLPDGCLQINRFVALGLHETAGFLGHYDLGDTGE